MKRPGLFGGCICGALCFSGGTVSAEDAPVALVLPDAVDETPQQARDPLEFFSLPDGAFDRFFAALDRATPGDPAVILHYGDSHSASGWFGTAMVEALAPAWVRSPGYISVTYPLDLGATLKKQGKWTVDNWLYTKAVGPFGPFGVAYSTDQRDAKMLLEVSHVSDDPLSVTCFYDNTTPHAPFAMRTKRFTLAHSEMDPPAEQALGVIQGILPPRTSEIQIELDCKRKQCSAPLRFYGCLVQNPRAQIEIDILAVGGTTIQNPLRRSGPEQLEYVAQRKPDLVSLWFGTNNTGEPDFDPEKYRASQIAMVERLRSASPESDCLIIGLPDRSKRDELCFLNYEERKIAEKPKKQRSKRESSILGANRQMRMCNPDGLVQFKGRKNVYPVDGIKTPLDWEVYKSSCEWHTMPVVHEIARIQREVALSQGCGFFDAYSAMGGDGAIAAWACETPARARGDLVHLSKEGYRYLAQLLAMGMAEKARERK